jgi:hypothetical protein
MQIMGDPAQCWALTNNASRVAVSLGYHARRTLCPLSDLDGAIGAVMTWCYHIDKSLGMLLQRPRCLPKLPVPASQLIRYDATNPMSDFVSISTKIPIAQRACDCEKKDGLGRFLPSSLQKALC